MTKNILLLVTGKTPQIITETVWALACDPLKENKWFPDEIKVITTLDGIQEIKSTLLGKANIFQKFIDEYDLPNIDFNEDSLIVITDEGNQPLIDLKTPQHNESAADKICEVIRSLTENMQDTLHVSIAGGRKTMGFYAGYALSLYGRYQDQLSHVLVSTEYEMLRGFFYPAKVKNTTYITKSLKRIENNQEVSEEIRLDTYDAEVWLANIPFVRLKDAVKDKHQLKSDDSFSEVVHKINESFNDVTLQIDLSQRLVVVNKKFMINDLPPREFAMLHWFADHRLKKEDGIFAPRVDANSKKVSEEDAQYLQQLTDDFCIYYEELKNTNADLVVDKKFFESVKSKLKESLETKLGLELASKIAIMQEKRGQPFYLNVLPAHIEIIDRFKN